MGKLKENDLNRAKYLPGYATKYVGCSYFTLKDYEKKGYLKSPVTRDANGYRRYTKNQLNTLRQIWLARNPE